MYSCPSLAMQQSQACATLAAMVKTTGWPQHSVRGFLAGMVRKRLKLKLASKKVDGTRVYQDREAEASTQGLAEPLPRSIPDADRGIIHEFAMDTCDLGHRLSFASATTPSNCSTPWRPTGATMPNSAR